MSSNKNGQVITFYSFKGGTGRSMALANLACLLSSRCQPDKGVLMIDWDLEAPGLHRYFLKHLSNKSEEKSEKALEDSQGLIELFYAIDALLTSESSEILVRSEAETIRVLDCLFLEKYVLKTSYPSLSLLKAGKFDSEYSTRVNTFGWEKLHGKAPELFRVFAQFLSEKYEYVLIDSRTGLTDTSGICTTLLPEKLVVVFTPNRQSLTGIRNLIESAADYRKQSDDLRSLLIFPLVSRLEPTENILRQYWRYGNEDLGIIGYQRQFENCFREIYGLQSCSLETYFDEVLVQHVPSYAYGEEIAVLEQGSSEGLVLKRRYENLLEYLLRPIPPWVAKELPRQGAQSEQQTAGTDEADLQSTCPYPGLRPFEENEHRFFFAREKITERLLKSLRSSPRFLALFGPSGSGKTSLINAGLIPRLRNGDLPASELWKIIVCRLGRDPFENLKASGLQGAEDDLPMAVTKFLGNTPIHPYLLLVIDPFEELFTIVEDAVRGNFIEQLIGLLSSDVPCIVLVAMRADFYIQFVRDIPGMLPWLEEGLINLPANLSREELRDIVEIPAEVSGVSFEEGLVETIVNDVESGSSSSGMLPLLQFSLSQLWERRREGYLSHFAYQEAGGLAGGLAKHAEGVFSEFSAEDKKLVKRILTSLVYITEDSTYRRRSRSISEFDENSQRVVQRLIDARLVFISEKKGRKEKIIEPAHEAIFAYWPRMRDWLSEDSEFLLQRQRLRTSFDEWERNNRSADLLLRGRQMYEALYWLEKKSEYLSTAELQFVIASKKREIRKLVGVATFGIIVLLLFSVPLAWLWHKGVSVLYGWSIVQARLTVVDVYEPNMVRIPGGVFQMGDVEGLDYKNPQPAHQTTMSPFNLSQFEVTFKEYEQYVVLTGESRIDDERWGGGRRPAINVSWENAIAYAKWLSWATGNAYRLPTEAEWEYAARSGGKDEVWAGTSDEGKLQDYAVYGRNFDQGTEPVGEKKANGLGLHDMSGNVWEWVADCWHDTYEGAPQDGSAWLEADGGDCRLRVIRGGSWNYSEPEYLRTSYRSWNHTDVRSDSLGFRLVQDTS